VSFWELAVDLPSLAGYNEASRTEIIMTIEEALNTRIRQLENSLREIRDSCAYNLEEPGNEDDTLSGVVDRVTRVLFDKYTFDMEAYLND
jgi:hypothetical protein